MCLVLRMETLFIVEKWIKHNSGIVALVVNMTSLVFLMALRMEN